MIHAIDKGPASTQAHSGTTIRVMEAGKLIELDYDGAMSAHAGSLWWGTAVAYRAMQVVAAALSRDGLWSRDQLTVVTAHPGGGVRDAVNYVTRAVEQKRFTVVSDKDCGMRCNSTMKYEWWVSDGEKTAHVALRSDFVPWNFYLLMDRLGKPDTTDADKAAFDIFKVNLSAKIWNYPLMESYSVSVVDRALQPGELPEAVKAPNFWDSVKEIQASAR
jgi:hypothetical protein